MTEREAWLLLVNATMMRADAQAYHDPMGAFRQACRDRVDALDALRGFGVDTSGILDPHGLWPSEAACAAWAKDAR
jgi:hypothetical protein